MTWHMTLRVVALATAITLELTACSDSSTSPSVGYTYVRVINSTYLDSSTTTPAGLYTAAPIDLLFDSATTTPSFLATAANVVSDLTDGVGPAPAHLNAGYHALPVGVHSFVARLSGLTPEGPTFFTTSGTKQYLPMQYLINATYYTLIIAGKAKPQKLTGTSPVLNGPADFGSSFPVLVDDPFTPPAVGDVLQARFRVINAAPFFSANGTGGTVSIFMTPGLALPSQATVSTLAALTTVGYRNASTYLNTTAGDFVVTIGAGTSIRYQYPITLHAGEVRTLVFQNNISPIPTGYDPASAQSNFKITNLHDNQY